MWDQDKMFKLIEFYSQKSFLWHTKHPHYRNKSMKNDAYSEIALCLDCEPADIPLKWIYLKNMFIKESRKEDESNGEYKCKWYAFERLSFLNNPPSMESNSINLNNYCRSCMKEDQKLFDVFSTEIGEGSPLSEVLYTLTGIIVSESDEIPTKICEKCKRFLEEFLIFKQKANEVQTSLQNILQDLKTNQEEAKTNKKVKKVVLYKCTQCDKSFKDKGYLAKHMNIHENLRSFLCDLCGRGFNNEITMKTHRLIHTGEKPFTCKFCDKKFRQASVLSIHISAKHKEKKSKCPDCGKCFTLNFDMERHRRTHTGERPFACKECDKTYTKKAYLKEHIRVAHRGFRYICDICHKDYATGNKLTIHYRSHTNETPYKCENCSVAFHRKDILDRHNNKFHFGDQSTVKMEIEINENI